jgi:hypothetical protein
MGECDADERPRALREEIPWHVSQRKLPVAASASVTTGLK